MRGRLLSSSMLVVMLAAGFTSVPVGAEPQEGDVVATGHIAAAMDIPDGFAHGTLGPQAGVPAQDLHSFEFDASPYIGLWLAAIAPDDDPVFHGLVIRYLDAAGDALETRCIKGPDDSALLVEPIGQLRFEPECFVPAGTQRARVSASFGAGLDVLVVVTAGAPPIHPDPDVLIHRHLDFGLGLFTTTMWAVFGAHDPAPENRADVTHAVGRTLVVDAEDHSGLGYDLRLRFHRADNSMVTANCIWDESSNGLLQAPYTEWHQKQTCIVPDGATEVRLVAYHARDVTVTVRLAPSS